MSIFKDVKNLWGIISLIQKIRSEKMDIKTSAGWLKIIGYVAILAGLVSNYIDPKIAVSAGLILSAIVKAVEEIVKVTPTAKDDEFIQNVEDILKKNNLLK